MLGDNAHICSITHNTNSLITTTIQVQKEGFQYHAIPSINNWVINNSFSASMLLDGQERHLACTIF